MSMGSWVLGGGVISRCTMIPGHVVHLPPLVVSKSKRVTHFCSKAGLPTCLLRPSSLSHTSSVFASHGVPGIDTHALYSAPALLRPFSLEVEGYTSGLACVSHACFAYTHLPLFTRSSCSERALRYDEEGDGGTSATGLAHMLYSTDDVSLLIVVQNLYTGRVKPTSRSSSQVRRQVEGE